MHSGRRGTLAVGLALGCTSLMAACGTSSTTGAATTPSPTLAVSPTPSASGSTGPSPTPSPTTNPAAAVVSAGAKSASCVNGWVEPAPGSDFYKQAISTLEQNVGGSGYVVKSVRYFAGPLASGGIGAVYYLDVRDPRLTSRVLIVSGAGPASVAKAKIGTTGWTEGDWRNSQGGDPVGGTTPLLSSSLTGCLAGS